MAVTYKDIDTLSQKSTLTGSEKLPVSENEYITPDQIRRITISSSEPTSAQGNNGDIWIVI